MKRIMLFEDFVAEKKWTAVLDFSNLSGKDVESMSQEEVIELAGLLSSKAEKESQRIKTRVSKESFDEFMQIISEIKETNNPDKILSQISILNDWAEANNVWVIPMEKSACLIGNKK